MPLKGWMTGGWGSRPPRASHRLGMFTVEGDSCWQEVFPWPWTQTCGAQSARLDSLEEHPCVPCVALYDTSGNCRATFVGARDPAWSPDGTRLAFRTVRNATVFAEGGLREFPESPESVVVFTPSTGLHKAYPAPTDAVSWLDDEALLLEFQGLRYGLTLESGYVGRDPNQKHVFMAGAVSPDGDYVVQTGHWGDGIWDFQSSRAGIWDVHGKKDYLPDIARIVDARYARLSQNSFWLRGKDYPHHLCIGVGRLTVGPQHNMIARYRDCETLVIDVEKLIVIRRIGGAFIGPTVGEQHVLVWQEGRLKYFRL